MPFAIVAELPLGTYRGAGADGRPEPVPSVARLHSALLCAAGFGPRAIERDAGSLELGEADEAALRWLEANPPDSVHIPALEVTVSRGIAYRDDGTLKKDKVKKLAKIPTAGTTIHGRFAWVWNDVPPDPVRVVLDQLCPDVAYLGTTESPVRLTAVTGDAIEATHDLDADAGLFTVGATAVDRPLPGRLEELSRTHRDATGKPPLVSRDRFGTDEKSLSPVPPREMLETIRFRPRNAPSTPVPWPRALVIPAHRAVPVRDRVAWAVATHRALIKMIGLGAPALITGAYPEGVRRPVNRVALHFLGPAEGWSEPALVVLIPAEADSADLETLHNAVSGLTSVRGPGGNTLKLNPSGLRVLAGDQFWGTPEPGAMRLWRTVPATVPDTRGDRNGDWNFAHAALLSVGFVCRKLLPGKITGRGPDYYRALALAASEAGVTVLHAKVIRGVDADRYVHKVNEHAVIRPYTAVLSLGTLTGPTAIMAMGQSRHLGGGLLVPFDVPEGTPTDAVNLREIEHG